MNNILLVLLGGGLGSVLRYLTVNWASGFSRFHLPLGVLLVNAAGSFIIGMLWGFSNTSGINDSAKAFVFIGLLGGFTTFSSFSLDTIRLFEQKEFAAALLNIGLNNILAIGLCYAGYLLFRH